MKVTGEPALRSPKAPTAATSRQNRFTAPA